MVSARAVSDISKFDSYCTRSETLNEWITTVRYKKGLIRRQRKHRDLRVAAVLHYAILKAEMELKRKQYERSQRWAQVRAQYEHPRESFGGGNGVVGDDDDSSKVREAADEIGHHNNNNNNQHEATTAAHSEDHDAELAELWSSELLGLDNLFNDLNQIKTVVAR